MLNFVKGGRLGAVARPRRARREPVQDRARQRRREILEATARVLGSQGFARTNTKVVAREAGASIGTVYEYFPDKESLYRALLAHYQQRLEAALAAALPLDPSEGWRGPVERLFDVFVRFYRSEPGYRELWLGSQLTEVLSEAGQRWGAEFSELLAPALSFLAPGLPEARARVVTRAALHMVSALVTAGLQAGGEDEEALVEEARRGVLAYLGSYLDAAPGREPAVASEASGRGRLVSRRGSNRRTRRPRPGPKSSRPGSCRGRSPSRRRRRPRLGSC